MALTAKDSGVAKVLPKMSRPNYTALVHDLGIDTVISPKDVTASQISSYVRGLANSQGSAVESLHKILGGAMEAVEFTATGATHFLNTPLKDLNFKPGCWSPPSSTAASSSFPAATPSSRRATA